MIKFNGNVSDYISQMQALTLLIQLTKIKLSPDKIIA